MRRSRRQARVYSAPLAGRRPPTLSPTLTPTVVRGLRCARRSSKSVPTGRRCPSGGRHSNAYAIACSIARARPVVNAAVHASSPSATCASATARSVAFRSGKGRARHCSHNAAANASWPTPPRARGDRGSVRNIRGPRPHTDAWTRTVVAPPPDAGKFNLSLLLKPAEGLQQVVQRAIQPLQPGRREGPGQLGRGLLCQRQTQPRWRRRSVSPSLLSTNRSSAYFPTVSSIPKRGSSTSSAARSTPPQTASAAPDRCSSRAPMRARRRSARAHARGAVGAHTEVAALRALYWPRVQLASVRQVYGQV